MKKAYKFTYSIAAFFAALVFFIFSLWGGGVGVTYAATSTTTQFEQSDIMDDLNSARIDGKKFDILDYPYDSTGFIKHPEILTVVEYCYSMRPAQRGNYGVYVYFYNPQALNIKTDSAANKITMGIAYSTDNDGYTKVDDYEKFDLQFCSKSSGDYRDLFYKFKVVDHRSVGDGLTIEQRVNSLERRYDISEVELLTYGDTNATAYTVGGTYKFTGYAAGYGADTTAESTLAMSFSDNFEMIELDIAGIKDGIDKRTYWRSNSSSVGKHHQNQINSVFFAIDTSVLEEYGYTLQKIKAEWWEYKTKPVVILSNKGFYDDLIPFVGQKISSGFNSSYGLSLYNMDSESHWGGGMGGVDYDYIWSWNADLTDAPFGDSTYNSAYKETLISLLFYTNGIAISDYTLTAKNFEQYCISYDKSFEKGHLFVNEHDFSADLFLDEVDNGRTRGYNLREFDITNPDDYWDIRSYDSNHNWWDKLLDYGFGSITTSDDYRDISPIQMLKTEDFLVSNVADHLKINKNDVETLKDYYNSSVADNNGDGKPDNAVFLFRYAQTDYWADYLGGYRGDNQSSKTKNIGEVRQGTQFFDFDILSLTFNKQGKLTTLGVVSSPVDHWSDYTPGIYAKYPDWWSWLKDWGGRILSAILVISLLVVICVFIPPVGTVLVQIVTLPFKAFGWLFKQFGKLFKKKE